MLKYIKDYRFRSIFLKNMCMVAGLLLLPFLITLIMLKGAYSRVLETEQAKYKETIAAQMVSDANGIMQEMYSNMLLLQGDEQVKLFAVSNATVKNEVFYEHTDITERLEIMSITSKCIQDIYLWAEKSDSILGRNGFVTSQKARILDGFPEGQNFGIYDNMGADGIASKLYVYYVLNAGKANQMTILYELNPRSFGEIICGATGNQAELMLNDEAVWASTQDPAGDKTKYTYVERDLATAGMSLRIYFEKNANVDAFFQVLQVQQLSTIALIVLILLIIWLVSVRMYSPVRTIMRALENYESDDFLAGEEIGLLENKNELEYILNVFYQETGKKQRAESELSERITMMKKAQMVALQAQINPHFIFNTLDAINWTAIKHLGKRNEVSVMTGNLAKMIRLFGENANTLISLEEEITYVLIYVRIMEMRCENKFSVQWDIPESLLQYKVVKLVLQPLVENAINHGALLLKEPSVISIRAYMQEGILYISVRDHGPGMQEQELENLKNMLEREGLREDRHFGLNNVNQRLRIMFGERAGVSIESQEGWGTEVTIAIPIGDWEEKRK